MRVVVKAKPSAFEEKIEKLPDGSFVVSVREPPINGQANRAIARVLAEYFGVGVGNIRLKTGFVSKKKVFEVG